MSKLKPLELEVKDLNNYRSTEKHLYAKCSKTGREMYLTFYGGIQVFKDGVFLREFIQEYAAVEFFNEL